MVTQGLCCGAEPHTVPATISWTATCPVREIDLAQMFWEEVKKFPAAEPALGAR